MLLLKCNNIIKRLFLRCYCQNHGNKTHYEVLNLDKNCTNKEIKEAFIQMSKKYHPDKNKDVNAQQQFVRIAEAYDVLGKPSSRAEYDNLGKQGANKIDDKPFYNYHEYVRRKSHNRSYYRNNKEEDQPIIGPIILIALGVMTLFNLIEIIYKRRSCSVCQTNLVYTHDHDEIEHQLRQYLNEIRKMRDDIKQIKYIDNERNIGAQEKLDKMPDDDDINLQYDESVPTCTIT